MVNLDKITFVHKFKQNKWCFGKCLEEEKAQNPEGSHLGVLKIVFNTHENCPDCGDTLFKPE